MILNDEVVKCFKTQLQQAVIVCSERCLFYSVKWATEVLDGIREDFLDTEIPFTRNQENLPTLSIYHNPYEVQLPPLTEVEYNKYQYAKALFNMRQFDSVTDLLQNSKSPRLYFLRLYAKYLAGEKRKEELTQEVLGITENAKSENMELDSIYEELAEDHEKGSLDAFSLYLYGVVLKQRDAQFKAAAVLLESIKKYQFNWSAWVELSTLVHTKKMMWDLQTLLNQELDDSIIKDFFLAKLYIDLHQPVHVFREIMEPLTVYFPNSAYITAQWAVLFYENMDYNESLVFFEELRSAHPSRLEDMDVFSNLLYLQESRDKLCILALECGKIDKYRAETCCVQANYYSAKRDMEESIEYFKRALKLNRSYPLAWTLLGHDYIEVKNINAAIECYRRAASLNSRDYRSWYGLGQAYELMKLPFDAIYYYQKATDLRPNDGRMWKALAGCYRGLRQEIDMNECYKRAVSCDSAGRNVAIIQVGRIYEKMGKTNTAINYYHRAWELTKNANVSDDLAEISLKLARYAMIRKYYDSAEQYALTALNAQHPYHEVARGILDEIRIFRGIGTK
ncbi:anaphase promoting complex subunit 8 [Helicostylum pulchrum]|nr:anaphase promoting complex subunit 8 [Helicostylum pulchrum]